MAEEDWADEPPDDGVPDFGYGIANLTINVHQGGQINLVVGDGSLAVTQQVAISPGDFAALGHSLRELGLRDEDVGELRQAIDEDGGQQGEATRRWYGRLGAKVADGALTGVAVQLIVGLVKGFFGF